MRCTRRGYRDLAGQDTASVASLERIGYAAPVKHDDPDAPAKKPNPLGNSDKKSRHVMPLGMRVLVRLAAADDRSAGGLFLPPGAKDAVARAAYGQVVEVARATADSDEGFGANVSGVPEGAFVIFPKDTGLPVPWDDSMRVVDVKDISALVEEIDKDEAH